MRPINELKYEFRIFRFFDYVLKALILYPILTHRKIYSKLIRELFADEAVLCCDGKSSSYVPSFYVIWSLQLKVHATKNYHCFSI